MHLIIIVITLYRHVTEVLLVDYMTIGLGDTSNIASQLLQQHNIAIIANIALERCTKVNGKWNSDTIIQHAC